MRNRVGPKDERLVLQSVFLGFGTVAFADCDFCITSWSFLLLLCVAFRVC